MRYALLTAGLAITVLMAIAAPARAAEGDDFVCPVFNSSAVGEHNPNAVPIGGGDSTILPGNATGLNVPDQATNGDGAGSPAGDHARPGDRDYTAVWNG